MGRVGVGAYDWFRERFGHVVSGIDFNEETVAAQLEAGRRVSEGDVMLYAVEKLKAVGYRGDVDAVARYDDEVEALHASGVDIAFNIYGEAGAGMAAHVCETIETFQS